MIKIQLYSSAAGTLTVTPDAQGTEDFEQTLKRSEATDGVVYEYSLDLEFTKQARAYLRDVYENAGGIEALVIVNAFEYSPNDFKWLQIGSGSIKFTNQELSAERFKTSIEQTGFQRKVLNMLDIDVDLDAVTSQGGLGIPATPVLELTMHPKAIVKESIAGPTDGNPFQKTDAFHLTIPNDALGGSVFRDFVVYGQLDNSKKKLEEYPAFDTPTGWDDSLWDGDGLDIGNLPGTDGDYIAMLTAQLAPRFETYRVDRLEDAGDGVFSLRWRLKHKLTVINTGGDVDIPGCGSGAMNKVEITAWFEHRDKDDNILALVKMGAWDMTGCGDDVREGTLETIEYSQPITMALGDKVYAYTVTRIYGDYEQPTGLVDGQLDYTFEVTSDVTEEDGSFIDIKINTSFPETTAKAYMVYEALNKTFQFYTDQADCFRSEYFGRTDSVFEYAEDGPGSLRAIISGGNIRKLAGRKTFANGTDFYQALNAIDCLGMGFETREGVPVVVINPLSYFYNKNSLILDLGPVSELKRSVATKLYCNQFEHTFGKIDIQQTNGIDEFGTIRRWKLPITQINTRQQASTKYKISGYEIENQRRLSVSTEDSKNDDAIFLIDLIRDGLGFKPRKDEDFTLVQNLYDPGSAYNLKLSPRRNAENWLKVLKIALIKSFTKIITFSYGEGNYQMITQMTGETVPKAENDDIDLTDVIPDVVPEIYKFKCPLSSTQMAIIRANPYGYFKFQEFRGGPDLEGFLQKATRNSNKKLGTFELIKVFR